ncbi:DUF4160 domain-containing protein [bacterium]|nr:DUF4160 domain-containing protein [bacterium]MDB4433121.1 DUF4160 domain-containing protein [bacterium]
MNYDRILREQIDSCGSAEELGEFFAHYMSSGIDVQEKPDGSFDVTFTRVLVERLGPIRIEIHPDEHPPPHFHAVVGSYRASFAIVSGECIAGHLEPADSRKVRLFHRNARERLIQVWNETRPTDCPVAPIAPPAAS